MARLRFMIGCNWRSAIRVIIAQVASASLACLVAAEIPVAGRPLPRWERGTLDIHQINTGTGDAALFILPDGTTWLLDAAGVNRTGEREPNYDAPPQPNGSLRAGQWIARYIRKHHPEGERGGLDYAMLTHFHGDHMGTLMPDSPAAPSGAYKLTGITDVGTEITIRMMLDRDWPDYKYPAPSGGAMMQNYRAFLKWQAEHRGLKAARFEAGRTDQIVLRKAPKEFPTFEVRNIAANGFVWTGSGTTTRNRFPEGIVPVENNCSLAFRLTYGAFTYFNGGDMAGFLGPNAPAWGEMESAVAWVTGPVDAYALNHHGTDDSANAFFLSVLQPRIHILSTYASSQPSPGVMRRMLSERIYPGARDIFMTNSGWPGRREHMVKLFGETETVWLLEQIGKMAANQGHVLLRVEPGGARYQVIVLDDGNESATVRSVHGPYPSRGARRD
jgi:beta-lactamase superfamily II metal-dependent hydrolase